MPIIRIPLWPHFILTCAPPGFALLRSPRLLGGQKYSCFTNHQVATKQSHAPRTRHVIIIINPSRGHSGCDGPVCPAYGPIGFATRYTKSLTFFLFAETCGPGAYKRVATGKIPTDVLVAISWSISRSSREDTILSSLRIRSIATRTL